MTKNKWLNRFFAGGDKEPMVRLYDPDTGEITDIRESQLSPGWIHADVEGIEGYVWVDPSKLQMSPIVHESLDENLTIAIHEIRSTFLEHRDISIEEWEDGFKRDQNPASEVSLWLHAARTYQAFVKDLSTSVERDELHSLVIVCLNSPRESLSTVFHAKTLDDRFVERLADRFYTGQLPQN